MATPLLDTLPEALAGHAGYLLVRLGKHAQRLFALEIEPLRLRPAHCDVLLTLRERGSQSQVQLASTLMIERAHLVALLDQLETLGLVRRAADPADRRRHAVLLTDQGAKVTARVAEVALKVENVLLAELTRAERTACRLLLQRLARDADEGD